MRKLFWILICTFAVTTVHAEEKKEKETELETTMGHMNRAFRQLKKQLRAEPVDFAGALESVATIKKSANEAMNHEPALAAEKSAEARPEFVTAYKQGIEEMLKVVDDLETALKAGDAAKAVELVSRLSALQKEGHKKFKKPE